MSWWNETYKKTTPLAAKGGIKAQSKSGSFGKSWWTQRWIATLESFDLGTRLTRGKSYARSGQVLNIDVQTGIIKSRVQGSRATPYKVEIKVKALTEEEWQKAADRLSQQAIFAAMLMAGEMPGNIEETFREIDLSLLPTSVKDISTDCSCPDWSNPCKHIAAVYYLLGEEFDRDPFLIFRMRGKTREAFLELLGQQTPAVEDEPENTIEPQPLRPDYSSFWNGQPIADGFFGSVAPPPVAASLPRRLGNIPFWRGQQPLLEAIQPIYELATRSGMDVYLGELEHSDELS